jgi:hypothetical protein
MRTRKPSTSTRRWQQLLTLALGPGWKKTKVKKRKKRVSRNLMIMV